MRPFGQIVQALNQLQGGQFDAALPPLAGTEAAAIGAAFNRMVRELQGHIESERRAVRAGNCSCPTAANSRAGWKRISRPSAA